MSVSSFIFLQPGGSLRADVVYSLPGAHNCPTIWAGAKSFPKGKAGRNKTASFDVRDIKALQRREPRIQGSARCIGVRETPCQGRGVRICHISFNLILIIQNILFYYLHFILRGFSGNL